jgi:integrase
VKTETHSKKGSGTIRTIKDRSTKAIIGYQALLPEALSKAPQKAGKRYRQPIGPVHASRPIARAFLDKALALREDERPELKHGLRLIDHLNAEIADRHTEAMRKGMNEIQANRQVVAWRSYVKVWVKDEAFAIAPPIAILRGDVQEWVNRLCAHRRKNGKPIAANSIHNMVEMVRAGFRHFNKAPERMNAPPVDPTQGLDLPDRSEPQIPHLELADQRALLTCKRITRRDRIMIGCGMGSGLRVNELLSIERSQVKLDGAEPHLMVRYGGKDRAPTKGRAERRVELFEPGLGFWRLWMAEFAGPGPLVFVGPLGGYLSNWPERFQDFATLAGLNALTSHYMRHTYAVSMLSGTWGYEPRTLEFVQHQLGHTEIQTTQRFYGTHTVGTWAREVALMTGKLAERSIRKPLTALDLLGASNGGKFAKSPRKLTLLVGDGQLTKQRKTPGKTQKKRSKGASAHHCKKGVA